MSVIFISLDVSSDFLSTISWSHINMFLNWHRQLKRSIPKVAKLHKTAKITWKFQKCSGVPLSALTVFWKWSKEKTYKLGQHVLTHQQGLTNNRLLSGPIFSFEMQENLYLHGMCFLGWWILPPGPPPWRWSVSSWSTSMVLIEQKEPCCICVYIGGWAS